MNLIEQIKVNDVSIDGYQGTYYSENIEWVKVILDSEDKILAGIKSDGTIEWGTGVPTPIREFVEDKLKDLSHIDSSINDLYDIKVDKEDGKSLIDSSFADSQSSVENPEFLTVITDYEDRVLEGIQADGTKVIGGDLNVGGSASISGDTKILGKMEVSGVSYKVIESPEYIEVTTDLEGKLLAGRSTDGAAFENVGFYAPKVTVDGTSLSNFNDPEERMEITTDNNDRILSYRKPDGTKVETAGIDADFIKSKSIDANKINLSQEGLDSLSDDLNLDNIKKNVINEYNLPDYGVSNVKSETFYLTYNASIRSIDDVVPIQDYEDTDENARMRMSIYHYYLRDTVTENNGVYSVNNNSIRLRHYASTKVRFDSENNKYYAIDPIRKVNGVCYFADTLGYEITNQRNRVYVIEGYTEIAPNDTSLAEGSVKEYEVEVVKVVGKPCFGAWTIADWDYNSYLGADIGKKHEHYCVCDIDFGNFLYETDVPIGIKHQGNSTQGIRKRNFRFTFYKNNTYSKKNKIKIGEMLRLSGFNLKSNGNDNTRIKEPVLYNILSRIWENRPITDRFNWDNEVNGLYHGATGNIKGFTIKLEEGDDFYGIYYFSLKKDEKNYMLGGEDADGLFVSGDLGSWGAEGPLTPSDIRNRFDDEMLDEISNSTADALVLWHEFINNRLYLDSDNNIYTNDELTKVDKKLYVTSTLCVDGNSVTAAKTPDEDYAYEGSDGNLYILSELTSIGNVLYVTATLEGGQPTENSVTAIQLDSHIYIGSNGERYLSNQLTKINGINYVTSLIIWDVTENSVLVEYVEFNKKNACERLDVLGFIDYFICLQTFLMIDNMHNNVLLYSDDKKKKLYPFFYDLDMAINKYTSDYEADFLNHSIVPGYNPQRTLWESLKELYWDEIINRYSYLKNTFLNTDTLKELYTYYSKNIPEQDLTREKQKWGQNIDISVFESAIIPFMENRFTWLNKYFNL